MTTYDGDLSLCGQLQDFDGNIIAMFRPIFPVQKYYIGEVHGEIFLLNNAGRGMVLFPVGCPK